MSPSLSVPRAKVRTLEKVYRSYKPENIKMPNHNCVCQW